MTLSLPLAGGWGDNTAADLWSSGFEQFAMNLSISDSRTMTRELPYRVGTIRPCLISFHSVTRFTPSRRQASLAVIQISGLKFGKLDTTRLHRESRLIVSPPKWRGIGPDYPEPPPRAAGKGESNLRARRTYWILAAQNPFMPLVAPVLFLPASPLPGVCDYLKLGTGQNFGDEAH